MAFLSLSLGGEMIFESCSSFNSIAQIELGILCIVHMQRHIRFRYVSFCKYCSYATKSQVEINRLHTVTTQFIIIQ